MSRKSRMHDVQQAASRSEEAKRHRNLLLALVAVLAVVMLGVGTILLNGWGRSAEVADNVQSGEAVVPVATHRIEIAVKDYGTITAELYGNVAPITVDNFVKLAREGFYDGLTFHRVFSGFMIQGGDPNGNGTGGCKPEIYGEFASNGWPQNKISHKRGVISMARTSDPNSASCQFFIVHEDSEFLDGDYAAFGHVTEGLDVLDAVASVPTYPDDSPSKKVVIKKMSIV